MIKIIISSSVLRVTIPTNMKSQAPLVLGAIWRDTFTDRSEFTLEMNEPIKAFIERAKLNPHILVCQ
jgi:hypothetical protein